MARYLVYVERRTDAADWEMIADHSVPATRPDVAVSITLKQLGRRKSTFVPGAEVPAPIRLKKGDRLRIEVSIDSAETPLTRYHDSV